MVKKNEQAEAKSETKAETKPEPKQTKKVDPGLAKRKAELAANFAKAADLVGKMFDKAEAENPFVPISSAELKESIPHITTGSFALDYLIGGEPNAMGVKPCPGWPLGRVINIYGQESSGKTTLALMACAEMHKRGLACVYIDWEHAISIDYAKSLGVQVENKELFHLYQPNTLEGGIKIAFVYAGMGVPLMIFDSVGFAVPTAEADKAISEIGEKASQPGLIARVWSREMPKLTTDLAKGQTLLIAISQLRSSINAGGMGPADTIQGGMIWKFVSTIRLRLKKKMEEKEARFNPLKGLAEDVSVAIEIEAKIDKIKIAPTQGRKLSYFITFGEGIDNFRTALDLLLKNGKVEKKGARHAWVAPDGKTIAGMGKKKFKEAILTGNYLTQFVGDAEALLGKAVAQEETEDLEDEGGPVSEEVLASLE